ncbi:hypothetical protein ACNQ2Q_26605, partial [Enterobacter cloacae complex sp.6701430]|uniref:hypothetical protein n=1 Tax=Enterobacter cloacae complex sp.6701430 TaxID=3397176 RepID=UPI003AAD44F9
TKESQVTQKLDHIVITDKHGNANQIKVGDFAKVELSLQNGRLISAKRIDSLKFNAKQGAQDQPHGGFNSN